MHFELTNFFFVSTFFVFLLFQPTGQIFSGETEIRFVETKKFSFFVEKRFFFRIRENFLRTKKRNFISAEIERRSKLKFRSPRLKSSSSMNFFRRPMKIRFREVKENIWTDRNSSTRKIFSAESSVDSSSDERLPSNNVSSLLQRKSSDRKSKRIRAKINENVASPNTENSQKKRKKFTLTSNVERFQLQFTCSDEQNIFSASVFPLWSRLSEGRQASRIVFHLKRI